MRCRLIITSDLYALKKRRGAVSQKPSSVFISRYKHSIWLQAWQKFRCTSCFCFGITVRRARARYVWRVSGVFMRWTGSPAAGRPFSGVRQVGNSRPGQPCRRCGEPGQRLRVWPSPGQAEAPPVTRVGGADGGPSRLVRPAADGGATVHLAAGQDGGGRVGRRHAAASPWRPC